MAVLLAGAMMTLWKPDEVRVAFGDFQVENLKPEYAWLKRPLVLVLLTIPATFVWLSYRLFGLYKQGVMFGEANVRYIKWLGYWMLGAWVISMPIQLLQFLAATEARQFKFTLDGGYFFGGVLVLLLAWIMEEGKKLQDEQSLTV